MRSARIVMLLAAGGMLAGCAGGAATTTHAKPPQPLAVYAGGQRVVVLEQGQRHFGLPERVDLRRGNAKMYLLIPLGRARRAVRRALNRRASRVDLPVVPWHTTIRVRPVRQVLHNDCEATSLSMLLASAGIHASQLKLQSQLPRSGPLDPVPVAGSTLFRWGDPERGFVGRPTGGGTEGGFGVYEPPIRALAAHYGVHLVDLRGRSVAAVRAAVLSGHPVLAWVGLDDGPFLTWLTPSGHRITVNLNEHAVVLVGAGPGYVSVNNPLSGKRERWSQSLFDYRWRLLGRRALELPSS